MTPNANLTLYFHPLSSFCQKAVIGLYELDVPFTKKLVDLSNAAERDALVKLWPMGKFPVLHDESRGVTVAESSIVLEYVEQRHTQMRTLIPAGDATALDCRMKDRFYDLHVNTPMGKIVTDKLRPEGRHDPHGVADARIQLDTAYDVAEKWLERGPWAAGEAFTMADCAAAPALFFARRVVPFGDRKRLRAYYERLLERPSVARTFEEAKPFLELFPG